MPFFQIFGALCILVGIFMGWLIRSDVKDSPAPGERMYGQGLGCLFQIMCIVVGCIMFIVSYYYPTIN